MINTSQQFLYAAYSAEDSLPVAVEPTIHKLAKKLNVPETTIQSCRKRGNRNISTNTFIIQISNPFYQKAVG